MEKTGKLNIPCTYCEREALPDTDPPVCAEHLHEKTAAEGPKTLKELDSQNE